MMKSFKFLFTTFLLTLTLVGCSGKKEGKTSTKVILGNALDISTQTGGIMVYGQNLDTGEGFGRKFPIGELELPNGFWEFAAIAYDGNASDDKLEGVLRCGYAVADLTGGDVDIPLSLSQADCSDQVFGTDGSKDGGNQPYPLTLYTCDNPKAVESRDSSECSNSVAQSYIVILPEFTNQDGTGDAIISACKTDGTPSTADYASTIKIPFFELGANGIPFQVRAFSGPSCSGSMKIYHFRHGHKDGSEQNFGTALTDSEISNDVYLYENPCTSSAGTGGTPFTNGDGEKIICTAGQMTGYMSGNLTLDYVLGQDIDFENTPYSGALVAGTFTGTFEGRKHTLSNLMLDFTGGAVTDGGLFSTISGSSSGYVRDLKMDNITLLVDGDDSTVGTLAGKISNGAQISGLDVYNVFVDISGSPTTVGGLIGNIAGTGGEVHSSKMDLVYIDMEEPNGVGGVVGKTGDDGFVRRIKADNFIFTTKTNAGSGAQNVGGIVGHTIASTNKSEVWGVSLNSFLVGTDTEPLEISSNFGGIMGGSGKVNISFCDVEGSAFIEGTTTNLQAGGILGDNQTDYQIQDVVSDIDFDFSSATVERVGGVMGHSYIMNNSNMNRVRSFGDIICGSDCGGIIGKQDHNGATTNFSEIIQKGDIDGLSGIGVGGIAGWANSLTIIDSVNRGDIVGGDYVGGFFGHTNATVSIQKSGNSGDIYTDTGQAGGLVGNIGATTDCDSSYNNGDILDYSSDGGSTLFEMVGSDSSVDFSSSTDCVFLDQSLGGSASNGTLVVSLADFDSASSSSLTTAGFNSDIDVNGNPLWIDKTGGVLTSYEYLTNELGPYNTGSHINPFELYTRIQFNLIQDDPFLMDKAFKLMNDISFNSTNGDFEPIGSTGNPFIGEFMGNDYKLHNITHTDSSIQTGVFRVLGAGAKIDHYAQFSDVDYTLYIDNAIFTTSNNDGGILAGVILDGNSGGHPKHEAVEIFGVHITNSSINVTAGAFAAGGIAGLATFNNQYSAIEHVYMDADVTGQDYAGGIIGRLTGSPTTPSDQNKVNMLEFTGTAYSSATNSKVGGIAGDFGNYNAELTRTKVTNSSIESNMGSAGGLIGFMNTGTISEGVVKYSTITDDGSGGYAGGLLGSLNDAAYQINISNSYSLDINLSASSGDAGGIFAGGVTGGSGIYVDNNYSVISTKNTASFYEICPTAGVTATNDSYYYFDGSNNAGSIGVFLSARDDINNSSLVPDLQLGTEFLLYGNDHPEKPFELFPELFLHD